MAIGRISGSVLKSNLTRNGVDLAFETNLLYIDVTNSRVGIGTSEPTTALQVNGTVTATAFAGDGSQLTGINVDTNIQLVGDDSTGATLGTGETFKIAGGTNITTAVSGDTLTVTGPDLSSYITATSTDTLQNKTLRAPVFESGSNSPQFIEQRFVNANQLNFVQVYSGAASGSYFTQGEYQKIATIIPDGDSQNYTCKVTMTATSASNFHIVTFYAALRSNTLPDLDWTVTYEEQHNGIRFIEPMLWTKETTTAGFILAFEYIHDSNLYGNVNCDVEIIPRSAAQRDNVTINTTANSEQASIDAGYTERNPTLIQSNVSGTPVFNQTISFEGATDDGNETSITVTDPTADRTITIPDATGTIVLQDSTDTLTNKTINSASNTITITESNISDLGSYITASSTDTLTNKTIDSASNTLTLDLGEGTLTGTTAEFNTALQDGSFATLAGTETLTNKTLTSPNINEAVALTATATELNYLDGVTGITLGTANELLIVGSDGTSIISDSTLSIDTGSNYIGINQSSPEVTLHMTGEGAQTAQVRMEQYNNSADAPDLRTRRYRGTIASPLAVNSGDYLYRSNHEYWNGSALIVGGTFAFDNTNNANRTQFAVSVTTDGTSADANTPSKTQFKIDGNDSGAITFNNAYKFPTADGTANQVLATDGSGTVSFVDIDTFTSITFVGDDSTGTAVSTNETFKIAGTQNITTAVSGDTLTITGPDLTSYITASSTHTLTNKTFDANGTGNSISNIEVADFASGVVDTDLSSVSGSDDTLASAKAIKAYVDGEISSVSTTTISEGNSSVDVDDGAGGAGQVIINVDGNNELVVNDTSATFSGNVVVTGDLTVNGTTTTVATTNTTVTDSLVEYSNGTTGAPANDAGIVIERGDENNAFIGFDESEDKFIVGTGTFTGASTGNLTITTGTLVANLEGNVTGNVTGTVSDISNHLLDEDNMATDSATKAPSQQSVKAYVDAQDANIASDTLTFTNKTFDANGTGNSISNIEVADFAGSAIINVSETLASNDSDTALVTAGAIIDYVDAQDANIASDTLTFTNKTIDANGTGNNISNIDSGNFLSGFFKDEDDLSSDSATSVASQQSIKAYVDAEVGAVSTSSISQGNSNVTVTDSGVGTIGITTDGTNIINFSTALAIDASNSNTAFRLPGGTTGQRPAGAVGMIRYNSSTDKIEGYTTAEGWAEFGAGASSSSDESGDSVIGIGPNPKNITTFTTGTYDSAFFYAILRDESNDEVSTARYSLVHNDTGAFVATSHVNESDTANDYMTVDADITDGVVRLRGTGVSNINSVSYYEIPLGDNTEAGTTGNVTKFINTDVDSASEVIDSFALSSIRGAKYFISTKDDVSGEVSNTEAIVVHDGSTAYITQYGSVNATDNNRDLLTLTVEVDSTVVLVKASSSIANVRVTGYRIALGDSESADTGDNVNVVAATTVNSGATALDTFASDVYTGAFYVVVGYNSTEGAASISEVSVVTNGGVSYVSTGPVLSTKGTDQLSFTTGVSGTTVTLNAASTSGSSTTVNAYRVHMLRGIGGAVADTVTVSDDETISGIKTFTAPLTLTVGSDPSTVANNAHIYAKDESSSAEVFVRDEAGNVTKISPHNEQGEWEYYSRNTKTGKTVRVNMEEMIRDIEKLTGKSYIKND